MIMKKVLICAVSLALFQVTALAFAPEDGDNFYVYTKGASKAVVYSLDNLDKLTFGDTAMSVWTNAGKRDYAYGDITLLTFRKGVAPLGVISQSVGNDIKIGYDRDAMLVSVESPNQVKSLTAFDMQGRKVGIMRHSNGKLQLSLAGLPQGVYVVKAQGEGFGKSVKIIK